MEELMILIDGNSLINRAFYALPPLTTADGRPSQAVYGFTTMLLKAIADFCPTHAVVAFDLPAPTFRHKCFAGYKATRKGMPDELAVQMPMLKELLQTMGIKILQKEGFEADDILGEMSTLGLKNIIITGDRDAFQLIDERTKVAFTRKGISQIDLFDEARFAAEFGFMPARIVDYKALCGDKSDNIPGVAGIGDKGATTLITTYGSLDGVYAAIDEIGGKTREKLIDGKESAQLSYKLATIERSVGLGVCPDDCILKLPFDQRTREMFLAYKFKSLAARSDLFLPFDGESNNEIKLTEDAENSGESSKKSKFATGGFAKKTESNSGTQNGIDGISNGIKIDAALIKRQEISDLNSLTINSDFSLFIGDKSVFVAWCNEDGKGITQTEIKLSGDLFGGIFLDDVIKKLQPALQNPQITKTVLDAKATKKLLAPFGITLNNFFDVRISQYLLDVTDRFDSITDVCDHCLLDSGYAAAALLAVKNSHADLLKNNGLDELYYKLEIPLVDVLFDMESVGFKLDMELNARLYQEFSTKASELSSEVHNLSGTEFNLNSPKQLAEVLFDKMQIPYPRKSKTHSTAFEILDPLRYDYPIVDRVLDYRRITKLCGTYLEGFRRLADADGVVHTDFKQTLTLTGRLSSVEPNLQNIPVREEDGRRLRGLFAAREGKTLVCADYSQIELRLLAHFSLDPTMTAAFVADEDIHAQTAALVYNVPLGEVTHEMRQGAKAVNFGIIYGISEFGLAKNLGVSALTARTLIENYFAKFSGIKEYLDSCIAEGYRTGCVKTVMGRTRRIAELSSPNHQLRKFGERVAMNTPLQGSAADIIKAAMVRVYERLRGRESRLILQVHDELIIEAALSEAEWVRSMLVQEMENVIALNVPLRVSVGVGKTWLDCK